MSEIKAGDRVRAISSSNWWRRGDVGTIYYRYPTGNYCVRFDAPHYMGDGEWLVWPESLELLEEEKPVIRVGQKWRCIEGYYDSDTIQRGTVVTVTRVTEVAIFMSPGAYEDSGWTSPERFLERFELVDGDEVDVEESNPISPNVYQFPNCEVRDISAHLTSFGGQAVQYIARATRLDGVVKGKPVEDIYKAIELLKWEAERLEAR